LKTFYWVRARVATRFGCFNAARAIVVGTT
jgi:hypothetical protein